MRYITGSQLGDVMKTLFESTFYFCAVSGSMYLALYIIKVIYV